MHIKEVSVRGFRTYRDPCVFQFCPGYNVIVGLNGSGKSNVLLAVSFALAETLEHANRSSYLYRGAESSEDDDFTAHVEVVFDISRDVRLHSVLNSKEELRLKRIFSRSKDLYMANGRQMSRKDYRQLIESVNLIHFSKQNASYRNDLHFIVKQGAVGKICSLSPEERLSAFRDVIGHRSFDSKMEESAKLLQDYDVTYSSVESQLSQIQRRLEALDVQRGAGEEWAALDAERRVLQAHLLQLKLAQLREGAAAQKKAEGEQSDAIDALQSRVDLLEMDVNESREALTIVASMDEVGAIKSELATLESSLEEVQSESAELRKEVGLLSHTKGELEHELGTLTASVESSAAELNGVESECLTVSHRIQDLETQLSEVMHRQRAPGEKAQEMISRLQRQKADAYTAIEEFESQKSTLSSSLARCVGDQELVRAEIAKLEQQCQAKTQRLTECTASLEASFETKRLKQSELSASLVKQSTLRVQHGDAEKNFSKVALSQKTTLGLVTQWLGSADSEPHRADYVGLLLDVLTVADAFKVAIEQTLGAKLFTVVVRTMSCARSLIRYVESSDLRYSNIRIVALEVLPASSGSNATAVSAGIDRNEAMPLIECVTFSDHLKPLVTSLLGDFCLVENADAASRLSHGRVNCVTPDGQVFYHRGPVSGGYVDLQESVLRLYGAMKQLSSDLAATDEHISRLNSELEALDEEQTQLTQQHSTAKSERLAVQEKLRQMQLSLQNLESLEESIRRKLGDNRKERLLYQIKSWDNQIEVFKRSASVSPSALEELAARQSALESDLAGLRRQKCALETRAHELHESASVAREKRNMLARRVITTIQMLEDYSAHLQDLEARSASLRQSRESLNSKLLRASEERNEAQQRRDDLCMRLHKLESELTTLKSELGGATARLRETSQSLSATMLSIKEAEEELSRFDRAVLAEAQRMPDTNKDTLVAKLAELNKRCSRFDLSSCTSTQDGAALRGSRVRRLAGAPGAHSAFQCGNFKVYKGAHREYFGRDDRCQALKSQKDANLVQMLSQLNDKLSQTFGELVPGGRIKAVLMRREAAPRDQAASVAVCLPECFVESPDDETFTGLDLKVSFSPRSESLQQLYQLSGGQKTLVSLAFILAAQRLQTAPFYLLDEIDAALDEAYRVNVSRLLERQCREGSQCILTTFRPELVRPGQLFYEVCNQGGVSAARRVAIDDALSVLSRCSMAITNGPSE
ncbi:RecF/RecN/SMC N terminal domain containing protein [Babesia caballi]|uniref:Structural maintenance of chromosomes protein n=1 Tax=Babesia caballi TaxID=5871 RepID=A0AAV4LPL5_BABCB|nr:RecF/RecN/SMC N terminal domain containing protein [Babesia caballi]